MACRVNAMASAVKKSSDELRHTTFVLDLSDVARDVAITETWRNVA